MKLVLSFAICLSFGSSALGQIDAAFLRAKYGAPLNRETFVVRPGVEMTVTYGPNARVCRLEMSSDAVAKLQADAALDEVLPLSMRGKDLNKGAQQMSRFSVLVTEYERVIISRPMVDNRPQTRPGVAATFKDEACRKLAAP